MITRAVSYGFFLGGTKRCLRPPILWLAFTKCPLFSNIAGFRTTCA